MRRPPEVRLARNHHSWSDPDSGGFAAEDFWRKLARSARVAGREVVEKALWLYYAAQQPNVPRWAKLTIWGALAYFVLPVDAVPDVLPAVGFVDDLGVLTAALATVAAYVDEDVKEQSRQRLCAWFGPAPAASPRS